MKKLNKIHYSYEDFFQKNPETQIYKTIQSFVPQKIQSHITDMEIQGKVVWIKVNHPIFVQLLLMKKKDIISALKDVTDSLKIEDLRCSVAYNIGDERFSCENDHCHTLIFAPTGSIEKGEDIEKESLRKLLDNLLKAIEKFE